MTPDVIGRKMCSEECLDQFAREGYFVVPEALDDTLVRALGAACDRAIEREERRVAEGRAEAEGAFAERLSLRGQRYFIEGLHTELPVLHQLIFGDLFASLAAAVLGGNAYLFVEQFVVKSPGCTVPFSWHQDSGYIPYPHPEYMSVWCALDAMSAENGTLVILPNSRLPSPGLQPHQPTDGEAEMVGYRGLDTGIELELPAGSLVVFSSHLMHRSGPNRTDRPRRAHLAQYSSVPLLNRAGDAVRNLAVPLVVAGRKRSVPFPYRPAQPDVGAPLQASLAVPHSERRAVWPGGSLGR